MTLRDEIAALKCASSKNDDPFEAFVNERIDAALKLVDKHEAIKDREDERAMIERDGLLDLITEVACYFGCNAEWSSAHDHQLCVQEYIRENAPKPISESKPSEDRPAREMRLHQDLSIAFASVGDALMRCSTVFEALTALAKERSQ